MIRRVLFFAGLGLLALLLLPFVLVPLYAIPFVQPVSTSLVADHFRFRPVVREWVPREAIADVMQQSVLMSEDGQFCNHHGVDWGEMRAVLDRALEGEATRGASTITMQTVKNLFLWNDRSYLRKALEIPYAIYMDLILSKGRILEIYLNIAEWDTGVYGIEAASQHYFGRSADNLTRRQAALLAVTLPAPGSRNAASPGARMNALASRVERLARRSGAYIGCLQLS